MADDNNFDGEFGESFAEDFLFKTPLYEPVALTEYRMDLLFGDNLKLDGFCPHCGERRTFFRYAGTLPHKFEFTKDTWHGFYIIRCTRHDHHSIRFALYISRDDFQKIGQHPSFADIAIDESKQYSKLLDKEDSSEFHKALGLAAHGIGIGSYVYLRRIFERLITKRYIEYKDTEGWSDEDFYKKRMAERIQHLKAHLPEFLVQNSKLYSILSIGVHELNEKDCLAFFPVLKQSTIWILEQDKKKKEELAQMKALQQAISQFEAPAPAPQFGGSLLASAKPEKT